MRLPAGIVLAHCPNPTCPSRDVPAYEGDDDGPGMSRRHWTKAEQWERVAAGEAPPRCGYCGKGLARSDGDERSGVNTTSRGNTWRLYHIPAGTTCHVRELLSNDPAAADAKWSDWRPHKTKHPHTFTSRTRARPGYWTFALAASGRYCEVEFSQLEIQVSNTV